jgi:signal transduction histidine kinase
MSYLLHPPLLDEAGFEAAAHWFIDGFAKRTAMAVNTNFLHPGSLPVKAPRMPQVRVLARFGALQKGLTNAHRHSASPSVEVPFEQLPDHAIPQIQDFGRKFPQAVMDRFQRTGAGSGVGLAGIREPVTELGGDFTISSTTAGTSIPLSMDRNRPEADPVAETEEFRTSGTHSIPQS